MEDDIDSLFRNLISKAQTNYSKFEDAVSFRNDIRSAFIDNYERVRKNIEQKSNAVFKSCLNDLDTIYFDRKSVDTIMVIAGTRSDEVFPIASLLFLLNEMPISSYNICAIPFAHLGTKERETNLLKKIRSGECCDGIKTVVILFEATPYFDGLYFVVPELTKSRMPIKEVLNELNKQGHTTGRFSVSEDRPLYEVVQTTNALISDIAEAGIDVCGLVVNEDVRGGAEALHMLVC